MVRYGLICKHCEGYDRCGVKERTWSIPCIVCDDAGCQACGQRGEELFNTCPLDMVTADVWEAIDLAILMEKGLTPLAGGVLDQTANFLVAARTIYSEKARCEQQLLERET